MKFKLTTVLALLLLVALMVVGVGCSKATGGGWFLDEEGDLVTFGFTAQPVDSDEVEGTIAAKGQFQLVDHSTKPPTRIHGTFTATDAATDEWASVFEGTCSIDGEGGHALVVGFRDEGEPGPDAGDAIAVYVDGDDDPLYEAYLGGGNIRVHSR